MKAILFLVLIFFSFQVSGQQDTGTSTISDGYRTNRGGVKGHPFFLDEWVIGYGIQADSTLTQPEMFNYDIHQNNLTYRTGNEPNNIMVVTNESLIGFVLKDKGSEDMIFLKFKGDHFEKSKKYNKFYMVLDPATKYVIVEPIKELDDPNASGWAASSTNTKSAKYDYKENIYILNNNGKYEQVNLKKSSVLKALKDKRNEISRYISSQNIQFNSVEDLIPVLEIYHQD